MIDGELRHSQIFRDWSALERAAREKRATSRRGADGPDDRAADEGAVTNDERWGPRVRGRAVLTRRPILAKLRSLQRFQWANVMVPVNEPEETPVA